MHGKIQVIRKLMKSRLHYYPVMSIPVQILIRGQNDATTKFQIRLLSM